VRPHEVPRSRAKQLRLIDLMQRTHRTRSSRHRPELHVVITSGISSHDFDIRKHFELSKKVQTTLSAFYFAALCHFAVRNFIRFCNCHYILRGDPLNFYASLGNASNSRERAWVEDELRAARAAGEKVYILGHIPPGTYSAAHALTFNLPRNVSRPRVHSSSNPLFTPFPWQAY
jgi:hypothetical protein